MLWQDPEKPTIHFGAGSPAPEVTRAFDGVEITPSPSFPTEVEPTTYPNPSSAGSPSYSPGLGSPSTNVDHTTHVSSCLLIFSLHLGIGFMAFTAISFFAFSFSLWGLSVLGTPIE